jgi:hypothetical protein
VEGLAPAACWIEIDVRESGPWIGAKAEKADSASGLGECDRVVVRHGNVEGGSQHVLRGRGAADGSVVAGTPIAGTHDQRLAEAVAQGLQLVQCLSVDLDRAGAAAGDLGRRKAELAPGAIGHVAEMGIGRGRMGLQNCKTRPRAAMPRRLYDLAGIARRERVGWVGRVMV